MVMQFDGTLIAALTQGERIRDGATGPITANSQTMGPGEWFVALAGPGFDDHNMVREAAKRGVAGVVVQRPFEDLGVGQVVVEDTWKALAALAAEARRRHDGPVVAISGSTGKTTTRALTSLALRPLGEVYQTAHNHNSEPGVSLTLLEAPPAAAYVLELGVGATGQLAPLVRMVAPTVRVLVNIGPAHLEALESLEGVLREKRVLFDTARPGECCVVNLDDPLLARISLPPGVRRVTFGHGGDVELLHATSTSTHTHARWKTPSGVVEATVPSPATYVAENATIALATAFALDVDLAGSAGELHRYEPVGRRLQRITLGGATVLADCFNANPTSMAAALRMLAGMPGHTTAVLGDMLELGEHSAAYHHELVALATSLPISRLVLVGEELRLHAGKIPWFATPQEAAGATELQPGETVLLKGSGGMRMARALDGWRSSS